MMPISISNVDLDLEVEVEVEVALLPPRGSRVTSKLALLSYAAVFRPASVQARVCFHGCACNDLRVMCPLPSLCICF
jgi:hypothetical protein